MRIGKVIGNITLSRRHPSLDGGAFRLAIPMTLSDLQGKTEPQAEELVVFDQFGPGIGSLIAISEGREAAQPFDPKDVVIDAYNAAILDHVHVEP